jgi:hypothetical protein
MWMHKTIVNILRQEPVVDPFTDYAIAMFVNHSIPLNHGTDILSHQPFFHIKRNDLRILLPIPACNLSPLCLNMYMTPAQLAAATIANGIGAIGIGPGFAALLVNDGRGCSSGENGSAGGFGVVEYSRGRRETRVRDKTYKTICSFIYIVSGVARRSIVVDLGQVPMLQTSQ